MNYWKVWLEAHPTRSAKWLQERISEGFEIHHLDPSKGDVPGNLVLIEGTDHKMVHGAGALALRRTQRTGILPRTRECGERAYELRLQGRSWRFIEQTVAEVRQVKHAAKAYALSVGRAWPIGGPKQRD